MNIRNGQRFAAGSAWQRKAKPVIETPRTSPQSTTREERCKSAI
jgi:hypothetical protein